MTDKTGPREVTIKIPRLPRDKMLWLVGGAAFLITFSFAASILGELNKLKQQQQTAEERIKKEVLMPGGTTEYKTEFKPDQKTEQASTPVAQPAAQQPEPAAPAPAPAPAPVPAAPAPPAAPPAPSGPGNFDHGYSSPSYGPSGPGNM
jgi:septal ring-binding cell division protein DamX